MNRTAMAKALGRRGGLARAKQLPPTVRRRIASLGGKARSKSLEAAKRIIVNFRYVDAIRKMRGRIRKVIPVKNFKGPLPGIYA